MTHPRKTCRTCKVEFAASVRHFYARRDSLDGLQSECKGCFVARGMANYYRSRSRRLRLQRARMQTQEAKEKARVWRQGYYATPAGKQARSESRRTWQLLNPDKHRAMARASKARRAARASGISP